MAFSASELGTFWKIGLAFFREVNFLTAILTFHSPKQELLLKWTTGETEGRGRRKDCLKKKPFNCYQFGYRMEKIVLGGIQEQKMCKYFP